MLTRWDVFSGVALEAPALLTPLGTPTGLHCLPTTPEQDSDTCKLDPAGTDVRPSKERRIWRSARTTGIEQTSHARSCLTRRAASSSPFSLTSVALGSSF
jgi:hypothetical protein